MTKIVTIIGARPQIIKAAALSRAIRKSYSQKIQEIIVHTGQHYDENMSKVFFDELEIPKPDYNLNVGSDLHGKQTAKMITGIEEILLDVKPDYIILYGDTNSTLAGSVAASKLHIPIVHIEAGMRSFNKSMPEEINRIICDHCSTLLFSPTATGLNNLIKEGFRADTKPPFSIDNPHVFHCGDIMFDNSLFFAEKAESISHEHISKKFEHMSTLANEQISKKFEHMSILANEHINHDFLLATIHRDNNTDDPQRLNAIFHSLNKISQIHNIPVIMPLHPRTAKLLKKNLTSVVYDSVYNNRLFNIIKPVSFLEMILLEKKCKMVFTDSGGVQKEAYFFKKPCIILRTETEWVEIIENNAAILADADEQKIIYSYEHMSELAHEHMSSFPPVFGNGHAAEFICEQIILNNK